MKIDSESPAVKAAKDCTAKGLSQDQENSAEVANSASPALLKAMATNTARTSSCSATSVYCRPLVAVMPR